MNETVYKEGNMTAWKNSSVLLCSGLVFVERGIKYFIIPALARIKQERLYPVSCSEILYRLKKKEVGGGATFGYQPVQR